MLPALHVKLQPCFAAVRCCPTSCSAGRLRYCNRLLTAHWPRHCCSLLSVHGHIGIACCMLEQLVPLTLVQPPMVTQQLQARIVHGVRCTIAAAGGSLVFFLLNQLESAEAQPCWLHHNRLTT